MILNFLLYLGHQTLADSIASSLMRVVTVDGGQRQLFAFVCVLVACYSTQIEIVEGVILLVMHRSIAISDFRSL